MVNLRNKDLAFQVRNAFKEQNTKLIRDSRATIIIWYDKETGELYGVGHENPKYGDENTQAVGAIILVDGKGARPELFNSDVELTDALQRALEQIREYMEGE